MKRLIPFLFLALPAMAQVGGGVRLPVSTVQSCVSTVAQDANCGGYARVMCVYATTSTIFWCNPSDSRWDEVGSSGGGTGGASDFSELSGGTSTGDAFIVGTGSTMAATGTGTISATGLACTDCVTMGTETAGNYAAGDAEAGNATGLACTTCVNLLTEVAAFTSSDLRATISDEQGTGAAVFATAPTISAPVLSGFTASRCARFNSSGVLVPSTTGDCDSGDTGGGGGDSILILSTAVTDGSGVDFVDGAGVDISYNSGSSPDSATFVADNTEINDTTYGDGSDSSIVVTHNIQTGTDVTETYSSTGYAINVPVDVADQITEPGNYDGIRDNDTAFTNDPTCANSGSSGELHFLDSDETASDQWDACNGTALLWRFPTPSTTTTNLCFATSTSGACAYRNATTADLPSTGTWTTTGAIDAGGGSVEVGNGTAPTVDAAGEVGVDTSASQLVFYDGTVEKVLDPREAMSIVLFAPTSSDDPIVFKAPYGMTITNIDCIVGAATSAVIDVQECSSTATGCVTVDAAITCDADGAADDGSLSNSSIDLGDWIKVDVGTVTGTVLFVSITVRYTIVRQ